MDHERRGRCGHDGEGRRFARSDGLDGPRLHRGPHRGRHAGHGGREEGSEGGRSGLGRFFAHGDLRLVILNLIAEKPRHGYEIIKEIEERVAGAYSPSPGVIYPTLTLLDELGHVTVSARDGAKKLHAITDDGRAFLAANRTALDPILARMDEASRAHGGGTAPPILRAMENLKVALRMRLARGPLTQDEVQGVAAALDAAATGVERC